jgi:hypothetical protein
LTPSGSTWPQAAPLDPKRLRPFILYKWWRFRFWPVSVDLTLLESRLSTGTHWPGLCQDPLKREKNCLSIFKHYA